MDEVVAAARGCAASSSSRSRDAERASVNQGGRPPAVDIDADLLAWLCDDGYSNQEMADYFGATIDSISNGTSKRQHAASPCVRMDRRETPNSAQMAMHRALPSWRAALIRTREPRRVALVDPEESIFLLTYTNLTHTVKAIPSVCV